MKPSLDPDTSIPYYEQIRAYLLAKIESGEFRPHTRTPSERVLSEQFGVSRMTVKHAIKELVSSGRLYTRVGKGTFVSDPPITQNLNMLTGFSEDMEALGKSTSSRVLTAAVIAATAKIARELRIPQEAHVVLLRRIRLADNEPVALENSYLNHTLCPGILDTHDFSMESLYAVLKNEYQLILSYGEQSIQARLATKSEADLLSIQKGFPLLDIMRTTFSDEAQPIEYVESIYRGDLYVFRARLTSV